MYPGLPICEFQQAFDYPVLEVDVDRTKASQGGFDERSVSTSILNSLSGSFQVTPMFFLNWENGVSYNLVTQTPQYRVQSLQNLQNTPITSTANARPGILTNVASIHRSSEMQAISHYNIRRLAEIYGSVQDRDLGAVARDVSRIFDTNRKSLPRGSFATIRGQLETMRTSYIGLVGGLVFSVILVYLLIVVNFQSCWTPSSLFALFPRPWPVSWCFCSSRTPP